MTPSSRPPSGYTPASLGFALVAAAVTSATAWKLGKVFGGSPDLAFLRWEGGGTIIINSLSVVAFWLAIIGLRIRSALISWELAAFQHRLLPEDVETVIDRKYIPEIFKKLGGLSAEARGARLCQAVELCASKFQASTSVGEVSGTLEMYLQNEANRADTGYSIVRYLAWSIPSIGFIGTVMGLASALGRFAGAKLDKMQDLMRDVSTDLMFAFNTTFVALALAIILMYYYHRVTERDETLSNRVSDHCLRYFVTKAFYPAPA
ncbi:MAG TPA: MotA/TolQ/ExbB proton channel family protein [Planctomycetota bacterium]